VKGRQYAVYVKQIYAADTPSIIHLIIVREAGPPWNTTSLPERTTMWTCFTVCPVRTRSTTCLSRDMMVRGAGLFPRVFSPNGGDLRRAGAVYDSIATAIQFLMSASRRLTATETAILISATFWPDEAWIVSRTESLTHASFRPTTATRRRADDCEAPRGLQRQGVQDICDVAGSTSLDCNGISCPTSATWPPEPARTPMGTPSPMSAGSRGFTWTPTRPGSATGQAGPMRLPTADGPGLGGGSRHGRGGDLVAAGTYVPSGVSTRWTYGVRL